MSTIVAGSEQDQATEISFFDVGSRIGRVRYLAYTWAVGLVLSPLSLTGLYETLHRAWVLGGSILLLNWIIATPIHFTFMVRRLHDLGHSGWWSLIYAFSIPFTIVRFVDSLRHVRPTEYLPVYLLVNLAVFGFALMLTFARGTDGPNRFGPRPPPNSSGVVAMAWSMLLLPIFVIVGVGVYVSSLDVQKMNVARAAEVARANIYPATRYFHENHHWPVDMGAVEGAQTSDPVIGSVGTTTYPDGGYGIVVRLKYSGSVEVWTTDNGENWHCGSPPDAPLAPKDLPADCQEEPPPTQ